MVTYRYYEVRRDVYEHVINVLKERMERVKNKKGNGNEKGYNFHTHFSDNGNCCVNSRYSFDRCGRF